MTKLKSENKPSTIPLDSADESVYILRLEYLYDQMNVSLLGSLLCYAIANSLIWSYTATSKIIFWTSALISIYILRELTYFYYKRARLTSNFSKRFWFNIFFLGVLASSIIWASSWLFLFYNPAEFETSTLVLVLLTGMTLTSIWSYSCFITVFLAFACPILLAIFFTLLTSSAEFATAIAVMMFVFSGFLMIFALRASSHNRKIFTLEVSNSQLEDEKETELDKKVHAEKALQRSQILWQQIVETAQDIIIRADINGRILYVNKVAEQITGYAISELIDAQFYELVPEDYRQKVKRFYMKQFLNKNENAYLEVPVIKKNGEIIWLAQNMQTVMIDDEIVEFQAVARDITVAKQSEKKLIDAKEQAEEARRLEEEFLANISHEMRTPLNAIVGVTNLLVQSELSEEQKEFTTALRSSSNQLLSVINDLLDLSKIEKGLIEFVQTQIVMKEFGKEIAADFSALAGNRGLTLNVHVDDKFPEIVIGDKNRLQQILTNLIGNSIKFTEKGSIDVYFDIVSNTEISLRASFSVQDTGIGIDSDALPNIFEDFKQAHINSHLSFAGTGLGLSIVKKLVELQGGSIEVESEVGKGSEFKFELDFDSFSSDLEYTDPDNSYDIPEIINNKEQLNFLIADDNEMNRLVTSKHLFKYWKNICVDHAVNGKEAVDKVKSKYYDIILMDLQMPIMDGYAASEYIRTKLKPEKSNIPIIALTAGLTQPEKMHKAGINDCLAKPFKPNDLREKILSMTTIKVEDQQASTANEDLDHKPQLIHVDYQSLAHRTDNDKDLMIAMIDLYLENTPLSFSKMQNYCNEKNWVSLSTEAHSFKPTPVYFGLELHHENSKKIEELAKNEGDTGLIEKLIEEMELSMSDITTELNQLKTYLSA